MSPDLDQRNGWPAELRELLEHYPRDTWAAHDCSMAQFWLEIHDGFRRECVALQADIDDYRHERAAMAEFAVRSSSRLHRMIFHLHGHHQIEDFHYFPSFRAAEARLAAGFDTLGADHEQLQRDIAAALDASGTFLSAAHAAGVENSTAQRHAADRYIAASETLYRRLCRHLNDEEDLIVPLMIARGA